MSDPLKGTTALVTGASRGIGLAVSRKLAAEGAAVVGLARSMQDGASEFGLSYHCNLSDPSGTAAVLERVVAEAGLPDVVILNAGQFTLATVSELAPEQLLEELNTNVVGAFAVLKSLLPAMKARGSGHVVTVGSVADSDSFAGNAAYAASKHALRSLHDTAAIEFGEHVRFTLVSPGATDTRLWDAYDPDSRDDLPARSDMMHPEDVAAAIVFAVRSPPRANVSVLRLG